MKFVQKVLLLTGCIGLIACVATLADDLGTTEWPVPADAAAKTNPIKPDAKSVAMGKILYERSCLPCHGDEGKGDGPMSAMLPTPPHDLSSPKISSQNDAMMFWKITTGKTQMPGFEKTIPDTDRWNIVNYVRTIAPPPPATASTTQPTK
jgi:mono/diheme cytochrome c family protein